MVKDLTDTADWLWFVRGLAVHELVTPTARLERHDHALPRARASTERKRRHVKISLNKRTPTHSAVSGYLLSVPTQAQRIVFLLLSIAYNPAPAIQSHLCHHS